jgi:ATP-dependent DNA ligase
LLLGDGEVVVPDADGRPNFSALRAAIGTDPDQGGDWLHG